MKSFLYVGSNGYNTEAAAYETADFIATSAGAADAGKPIVLDAAGHIDASMINDADIDHGNLTGLSDDDHAQYILVAGTRAFTGDQSMGGNQLTGVGDPTASAINSASDDAIPMSFLASTAANEGASRVGIEDAGGYYAANNVEAALQEIAASVSGNTPFTVGVGGVTKGDAVYISANNTVLPLSVLTQDHYVIGLAQATVAAAGTVQVAGDDEVVTGVLSGATAGAKYYWSGTAHSTTRPNTSNQNAWRTGVAKNATDLYVQVEHVNKNAA